MSPNSSVQLIGGDQTTKRKDPSVAGCTTNSQHPEQRPLVHNTPNQATIKETLNHLKVMFSADMVGYDDCPPYSTTTVGGFASIPSACFHRTSIHTLPRASRCLDAFAVALAAASCKKGWYTSTKELQLVSPSCCAACRSVRTLRSAVDMAVPHRFWLTALDRVRAHRARGITLRVCRASSCTPWPGICRFRCRHGAVVFSRTWSVKFWAADSVILLTRWCGRVG